MIKTYDWEWQNKSQGVRKYLQYVYLTKGSIPYSKELQINNKKTNIPIEKWARAWTDTSQVWCQMTNKPMKGAYLHLSSGQCRLKPQSVTWPTHHNGWNKKKNSIKLKGCRATGILTKTLVGIQVGQLLWREFWQNIPIISSAPAVLPLGMNSTERHTNVH